MGMKSPLSDSLAADESGLGIENLNDRLLRYAGGKTALLIWQIISQIITLARVL